MKNTILKSIFAAVLFSMTLTLSANNNPAHMAPKANFETYFVNTDVEFMVEDDRILEELALVTYNQSNAYFSLKAMHDVEFIQVFNINGDLEFQIPVKNSLLHISLQDFNSGDYYVNILFSGQEEYLTTMLTKK